jgi:hypothetical protein
LAVNQSPSRLLQPQRITDPNGSVTEVRFDTRGMVAATALRGNDANPTGDNLGGIGADLTAADIALFNANPAVLARPGSGSITSVRRATSRFVYDMFAACDLNRQVGDGGLAPAAMPVWAATLARQFHVVQDGDSAVEIAFAHSDGFGPRRGDGNRGGRDVHSDGGQCWQHRARAPEEAY